ncbi:hypothetical protein [Crenalkalicoccus roseus]|uniref:hypothetical protein n=1 Tax=Crenalkalicoccus roseus TaxID=1485588 RepID=UPI0010800071|nr:hypothetical protein [Crenalkalicoccus roseus]
MRIRAAGWGALAALALAAAPAAAREEGAAAAFPQIAGEIDMGLFGIGTFRAGDRERRGSTTFLFGEMAAGLHLSPRFSLQGLLKFEPAGEVEPGGTHTFLRHQAAFLKALYLDWRPHDRLGLFAGKFGAPFGYGHHDFPGVLTAFRAHETYAVDEALGFGATWTWLADPRFGEHDISAAVFTLDTTPLSNTVLTRRRCCEEGFDRFRRNTLHQGGAGNTGRLDNLAIALDGERMPFLPNVSYHLALLSRGPGKDGTRREWGFAVGARYEVRWTAELRTLFFGEHVEFRNADGRPLAEPHGHEAEAAAAPLRETRRFSTLGAQTSHGPWRATLAWQRDERKRSFNTLPTENHLEISVGRSLGWGFGLDAGYQYARYAREDGTAGHSSALIGRLGFRREF